MKLKIEMFDECKETEVNIKCKELDNTLKKAVDILKQSDKTFAVRKDNSTKILKIEDICYFESVDEQTFVYTQEDVYSCQKKLYEAEEILSDTSFVRISKSCILNIDYLESVRALLNGKLEGTLSNDERVIINRHYVPAFKKKFGV